MLEDDGRPGDALLEAVVQELRRPVALRPDLDARVLEEIRLGSVRPKLGRLWAGLALAAGVAGLLLASVLLRSKGNLASTVVRQPVQFSLEAPSARHVAVVGDFNNWDPQATPLHRTSPDGRWLITLPLAPGRYQYTFIVDGARWTADPAMPPALGDDFGAPTSVITIGERVRT